MSAGDVVSVNERGAVIALTQLRLNLRERGQLLRAMGQAMLVSIRRTFREQGSPAGSWVPLAPSTVKRNPKKYGAGHKLLIDKAILLNSINVQTSAVAVVIGTNVKYAAVHNFGSRDRTGGPFGPQAKLADRAVHTNAYGYRRERDIHYQRVEITRADGSKVMVPRAMPSGKVVVKDRNGRERTVNRLFEGPRNAPGVEVSAHARHQNIPARPYMVFRPEDPARLNSIAEEFVVTAAAKAGLRGAQ